MWWRQQYADAVAVADAARRHRDEHTFTGRDEHGDCGSDALTIVYPCTLRTSLEGQPPVPGPSFALDANTKWRLCIGGAAAGSSEKYLFRTTDGGATWTLISQTTLGNPTPQRRVGELPNGNAAVQILFLDATHGWLGLSSPGVNLFRSQDSGVTWAEVPGIPPGVPVTSITFSDAMHGTVVTPEGTWATSDGGVTWTH